MALFSLLVASAMGHTEKWATRQGGRYSSLCPTLADPSAVRLLSLILEARAVAYGRLCSGTTGYPGLRTNLMHKGLQSSSEELLSPVVSTPK